MIVLLSVLCSNKIALICTNGDTLLVLFFYILFIHFVYFILLSLPLQLYDVLFLCLFSLFKIVFF